MLSTSVYIHIDYLQQILPIVKIQLHSQYYSQINSTITPTTLLLLLLNDCYYNSYHSVNIACKQLL